MQAQLAASRAQFYYDVPAGPFYGFTGSASSEAVVNNWWRQGMMGSAKAHYDGIVAFSQTDFTEDLKGISIPVLVIHGDVDQVAPMQIPVRCQPGWSKTGNSTLIKVLPTEYPPHMPIRLTPSSRIYKQLILLIEPLCSGIRCLFTIQATTLSS